MPSIISIEEALARHYSLSASGMIVDLRTYSDHRRGNRHQTFPQKILNSKSDIDRWNVLT